jgi:hypothetical protein
MKFSPIPRHPRATRRWFPAAAVAPLIAFAAGCASPGPPKPPSLNLPETVKDLTADRIGDTVHLQWTTPETTTDRLNVKDAMTAEICRFTVAAHPPQPSCTTVTKLPVQPGLSHAEEALPPNLTVNPPALLAYRVQIFNVNGHSAGHSPEAFVASGAAPPPVEQLRATPTRDGAMLEWQPTDTTAPVELDRLPVGPDGAVIEPPQRKQAAKSSKPTLKKPAASHTQPAPASPPKPLQIAPATAPIEVKLRTPPESADPGGTIDHTAEMGETYRYTARRVRTVTLGGHTLELRSSVSPPVTVAMRDTFPPKIPSGLEAVPEGATPADRSIDLSWTPDTDADLAGYFVYRQEVDPQGQVTGTVTRLNITPVVGPAYRDQTALAGHRYAYRVTAVDTAGNESAPSADVQETLREQ